MKQHRGRRMCLLRQGLQSSLGRNVRRTIRRHINPFLAYLRSNIRRCKETNKKRTDFVPFLPGYTAADVANISAIIRKYLKQGKVNLRSTTARHQVIFACLAAAFFFTSKGAEVVDCPPYEWTKAYSSALKRRLWAHHGTSAVLFNPGCSAMNVRNFQSASKAVAKRKVDGLVGDLCGAYAAAVAASRISLENNDDDDIQHVRFSEALTCNGAPAWGYIQNLAVVLLKHGRLGQHWLPKSARLHFTHALQSGASKGIARLAQLSNARISKPLARLYLRVITEVVQERWNEVNMKKPEHGELAQMIAHQLCEWAKAGFAEEVASEHKMIDNH